MKFWLNSNFSSPNVWNVNLCKPLILSFLCLNCASVAVIFLLNKVTPFSFNNNLNLTPQTAKIFKNSQIKISISIKLFKNHDIIKTDLNKDVIDKWNRLLRYFDNIISANLSMGENPRNGFLWLLFDKHIKRVIFISIDLLKMEMY